MFRRRRPTASGRGRDGEGGAAPPPRVHSSPAFRALVDQLESQRKPAVLDLGPAVAGNVRFFTRKPSTFFVEDVYRTLAAARPGRLPADLLSSPAEERFDAVLAWDLFDHLAGEVLEGLVARVRERCRPGALLFTLAAYVAEIPDRPIRFRVVDRETLIYGDRSPILRPSPRRAARDMDRLLSGFTMQSSYLLRNGWQEFLYERRAT